MKRKSLHRLGWGFVFVFIFWGTVNTYAQTIETAEPVPLYLWRPGGGPDTDASQLNVQTVPKNGESDFTYAFLGVKGTSPWGFGYAEYICEKSPQWAALPRQVKAEIKFKDPNMNGDGPRLVIIRFRDATGTVFQWNLAKVNSTEWAAYTLPLKQGRNGFVSWNDGVKDSAGHVVSSRTGAEVVGPVQLYSLLIHSQASGDNGRGIVSIKNLQIEE